MDRCTVREGTVLLADGKRLIVRVERGADEECGGCGACALKSLCKGRENRMMDLAVTAPAGEAYRPGDAVTVAYTRPNQAVAALVLFLPALAGLAAGGWLAGGRGDGALLAGCAAGFAAGLGLSWWIARRTEALRPSVRVVRGDGNG